MFQKCFGVACPHCGCQESETIDSKDVTTYGRQPGSTRLVILRHETKLTRCCAHCRRQFSFNVTKTPPTPIATDLQPHCHHCCSPNVRELRATPPTRSGIVYYKFQCRDCHRQFNLTKRTAT